MTKNYRTLSIMVPVYNEENTVHLILDKLDKVHLPNGLSKEIVVINDGSKDGSKERIETYIQTHPEVPVTFVNHKQNQGKGMALRSGIAVAQGDIITIQDADLECDPADYPDMLPFILSGEFKVVYGSRFLKKENVHSYKTFYWGGRLVSIVANILYGLRLTDEPTCYKMFDADVLRSIPLECMRFEFCPEVTAKIAKRGYQIKEVPIHYYPRSKEEGKKVKWHDGIEAIWTLVKYRFHK